MSGPPLPTHPRPLPSGAHLRAEAFATRHRVLCVALGLHLPLLAWLALTGPGADATIIAAMVGPPAGLLALAALVGGRRPRALAAATGLLWSSAALAVLTGGAAPAQFHFLIVVALLTLYLDWWPIAAALGVVVLAAGAGAALDQPLVYGHAGGGPWWWWPAVHTAVVTVAAVTLVATWRATAPAAADGDPAGALAHGAPHPPAPPAHHGSLAMPPPPAPQGGVAASPPTSAVADAAPAHHAPPPAAALVDEPPVDEPPADEPLTDEPTESAPARGRGRRQRTPATWSLPVPDSLATQAADNGNGNGNGADVARARPAESPSPSGQPAGDQASSPGRARPADRRGAEPVMNGGDEVDRDDGREAPSSDAPVPAGADAERSRSGLSAYQDGMQRARSEINPSMLRDFLGVDGDKE